MNYLYALSYRIAAMKFFFFLSLILITSCSSTPDPNKYFDGNSYSKLTLNDGTVLEGYFSENGYRCNNCTRYGYGEPNFSMKGNFYVDDKRNWNIKGEVKIDIKYSKDFSTIINGQLSDFSNLHSGTIVITNRQTGDIQETPIGSNSINSASGIVLNKLNAFIQEKEIKIAKEKETQDINKKVETCEQYGFTKGTELHQRCVLEILQAERDLNLKQKELEIAQNNKNLNDLYIIQQMQQNDVLSQQIQLQNSLEMMQLGLDLLTPSPTYTPSYNPPINCIFNPVGWSCM